MRCLFVNWKDGTASQFSVPDDYRLPPAAGNDQRSQRPTRLTWLDLGANAEMYLDLDDIRSAFCMDIAADRTIVKSL